MATRITPVKGSAWRSPRPNSMPDTTGFFNSPVPADGAGGSGMACPKPAGGICHEFIANDNANNRINYINEFTSTKPGGTSGCSNGRTAGCSKPTSSSRCSHVARANSPQTWRSYTYRIG